MTRPSESPAPLRAALFFIPAVAVLAQACPAAAGEIRAWTQFTPQGLEARAITDAPECPKIAVDGREAPMSPRAKPSPNFPNLVCSAPIPKETKEAAIDKKPLALAPARFEKILLIGDTGCRLKAFPPMFQDCNSPEAWPFRKIAEAAAAMKPDLVAHLGDLYYRETPCPPFRAGCAGSPYGDNWETWKADFFAPAEALLGAAPFVFVRGNHEECRRGGKGWARMIDAYPAEPDVCRVDEAPYALDLGGATLVVMDTIGAEDRALDEIGAAKYKAQFEALAAREGPLWLAFHKPVFATIRVVRGASEGDNKTLAEAARTSIPSNVEAILSGHLHVFEVASYKADFPVQIVAGHGGDLNEKLTPANFDGLAVNGMTVDVGRAAPTVFGFGLLERGEGEWRVTGYDALGEAFARCRLRGRKMRCD
jgi:3',5'-cyclic AMP phosphodiesterase CpdA